MPSLELAASFGKRSLAACSPLGPAHSGGATRVRVGELTERARVNLCLVDSFPNFLG